MADILRPGVTEPAATPQPPVRRAAKRRRPTGAPPPLPKKIGRSGKVWLAITVWMFVIMTVFSIQPELLAFGDRVNTAVLRFIVQFRTPWLTRFFETTNAYFDGMYTPFGLGTIALLMIFRRWRHLLVFLGAIAVTVLVTSNAYVAISKPRPYGVQILGDWGGFSVPAIPVVAVTAVLIGIIYTLVVPGRPRSWAKAAVWSIVGIQVAGRMYLAIDHPGSDVFAVALGAGVMTAAFRMLCPNEVFPVVYRRGNAAHLDVEGRRGAAIRQAIRDQLGLTVLDVKPVGLAGSSGSTPLRMRVAGDPDTFVFAKLYARSHLRSDRWYKLWRTILYGALEDEAPFQTVRRLVEYEDHMIRLIRDSGITTARPYGIVEITPEREYMLVTEFFDRAVEISEAEIDDRVIDSGLELIRKLWDAGVAHRDIKPANLLVLDGKVLLIDVFFAQVRPSPWRQAVDLGNMMLVLAVGSEPRKVYDQALRYFTADELAEAVAATRGVASPSQLRAHLKQDGRDLLAEFRALAPARRPIVLQRWSAKRVGVAIGMFGSIALTTILTLQLFTPVKDVEVADPFCGTSDTMITFAQSVPSASMLPCAESLPTGWSFGSTHANSDGASFVMNSDQAGISAVSVALTERCDTSEAIASRSTEPGTRRFDRTVSIQPTFEGTRYYTFPGGCVTYRFKFLETAPHARSFDVERELTFMRRDELVDHVGSVTRLPLCGRDVACPG